MLFLYYPKCSTCQKAKKWLDNHNIEYIERHIVEDNPKSEEIIQWNSMSNLSLKKFFNTSGLLYKQMNLKEKLLSLSEKEQIELLSSDGMLVKRPIIVTSNTVLVGFNEKQWKEKLN